MVMRSNSFNAFSQLRDEVDRLVTGALSGPAMAAARFAEGRSFPAVNVWEDAESFYLEAEVPGLKNDDLDISVVGNELTIKGERPEADQKAAAYHRRERGVGSFVRLLRLPADVDGGRVEAKLTDGVLQLTLPKAESAKPRKIVVNPSN